MMGRVAHVGEYIDSCSKSSTKPNTTRLIVGPQLMLESMFESMLESMLDFIFPVLFAVYLTLSLSHSTNP